MPFIRNTAWVLFAAILFSSSAGFSARLPDASHKHCDSCEEWNTPVVPFRLFGDSYYVGTQALGAVLIRSSQGLILIDGGLPQSAPLILNNIKALGFEPRELRWILNSHAHFDHAGGIRALAQATRARVGASRAGARALRAGLPPRDDPQAAFGEWNRFPAVKQVHALADGDTITVGETVLTALATPGHTPGGMSYSWRQCEGAICQDLVFADSLNAVSADGFQFNEGRREGESQRVQAFRDSIVKIAQLPCDVLISAHPEQAGLWDRLKPKDRGDARLASRAAAASINPSACRVYAEAATKRLNQRLLEERTPVGLKSDSVKR